jgi:hypothetical protein
VAIKKVIVKIIPELEFGFIGRFLKGETKLVRFSVARSGPNKGLQSACFIFDSSTFC